MPTGLYTLPELSFVGGATQDFEFDVFSEKNNALFDLSSCTADFSIVGYLGRDREPIVSKMMDIRFGIDNSVKNVLHITLLPSDTVNLYGKYVYQVSIKDAVGKVEIPSQGIMYIQNNINKRYAVQ